MPPAAAAPTESAVVEGPEPSEQAPPELEFSTLHADAERKAKLAKLKPQIEQLLEARVGDLGVTGAGFAIVLEGEVVYQRGFGVRDVASKEPVDEQTVFRIGSVSKTITALAVMRLRDQGRLQLDVPAARYLPAIGSIELPTRDSPPITVRHLLTMTSGLPYDDVWGAVSFGYDDAELRQYLAGGLAMAGAPGEAYRYSNLGFALLGKIVERVAGVPFETFVAREVFEPLDMTSSGYVTGEVPTSKMAVGYYRDGERLVPEPVESDGVFAPAGGAYTTLADLARYAAFQLAAYPPRDDPETGVVRRSTLREMHTGRAWARWLENYPVVKLGPEGDVSLSASSYGFGWVENTTCLAERMVQHGGYEPGYFAVIRLLPRERLGVVVMSTTGALGQLKTFEQLLRLLDEGGVLDPHRPPVSPELVDARSTVMKLLDRWDPEVVKANFDPQTQRFSFARNFRRDFERLSEQHGRCRPEGEIVADGRRHGRFRVVCEKGALNFGAYLTPGGAPAIQIVDWQEELPVSDQESTVAGRLVTAINQGVPSAPGLFAENAPNAELSRRLALERVAHGDCKVERALYNDGKGNVLFELMCGGVLRRLSFRLDPDSLRVADLTVTAPREYGAVCFE